MMKTILEIYALAVCFFTVACFVITLGLALWNVVELSAPEFTINNQKYECHQTDEAYRDCFSDQYKYRKKESPETFPTGEVLTKKREFEYSQIIKSERREALQGIVQKSIIILVDIILFIIHWKLAIRARENAS
ncbi:hypothetical protein SAMN02745165_03742 [Malonomonas rubra DSM 5091]|uniref:Uncharacterized protein n=1 Tax=Malonomonas rubra DSM 5091 TaxID=1122189 RepID=A0A1M6NZL4_MALRU|nr:hypothetical protein [Malonomonas rubra]SHK01108.1 hypothetical protein SAMN02745165_03742 [Malonomonas rubra DSM 5091]